MPPPCLPQRQSQKIKTRLLPRLLKTVGLLGILGVTIWIGFLIVQDIQIKKLIQEGGGISLQAKHETKPYPSFLYFELKPGEQAKGSFILRNGYDKTIDLRLSATDAQAIIEDLKSYEILEKEEATQYGEFGTWATFPNGKNTEQLTLGSKEVKEIPFTIIIPEDTAKGFYWGAMFSRHRATENPDNKVNVEIRTVLKTMIQVTDNPKAQEELRVKTPTFVIPRTYRLLSAFVTGLAILLILGAQIFSSKQ